MMSQKQAIISAIKSKVNDLPRYDLEWESMTERSWGGYIEIDDVIKLLDEMLLS